VTQSLVRNTSLCILLLVLCSVLANAQTAVVTRNVYVRSDPSTANDPIVKLTPGNQIQLLDPGDVSGFYHVRTSDGRTGYVWSRNVRVLSADATGNGGGPVPLLDSTHPVDWWFVFKFNSAAFPGCGNAAVRSCRFGGTVQDYNAFGQRYVVASNQSPSLKLGLNCVGDTTDDPIGATFDEIYNHPLNYIVWNDQFYRDPAIQGCGESCSAPWGHSKGVVAWNDNGNGVVMQVTTPSWPAAGNSGHPRVSDGNTLGCIADNDVKVSQHFFALKLIKPDLLKLLSALQNASIVTDVNNSQVVHNGGPQDIQVLVRQLGTKSSSTTVTDDILSSGVELISKPSKLNVPPWQLVSATLGGISLRTATWWSNPEIPSTTTSTTIACWDDALTAPGAVEVATSGHWNDTVFGLTGGPGKDFNHAKIGVATTGSKPLVIFGDMNQQGTLSGPSCASSQNGRGGLFFVVENSQLAASVKELLTGNTAPAH